MDVLLTLDFVQLCRSAEADWNAEEPIAFDDEGGLAICRVSPEALQHVLARSEDLNPEQLADLEKLRVFIQKNGSQSIYELSTF
jgi:hypothetical protein